MQELLEGFEGVAIVVPDPELHPYPKKNLHRMFDRHNIPLRNLTIKGPNERGYSLEWFRMRWRTVQSYHRTRDANEKTTYNLMKNVQNSDVYQGGLSFRNAEEIAAFWTMNKGKEVVPWFQGYAQNHVRLLSYSDYEYFDHPVACIFVVSTTNEDPVKTFLELEKTKEPLIKGGLSNKNIVKFYLFLHDDDLLSWDKGKEVFSQHEGTYGKNCGILRMNFKRVQESGITTEEIKGIKELIMSLISKTVIPHMQAVVNNLHQLVGAKRGFVNTFSSMMGIKFGRTKKSSSGRDQSSGDDSQTRQLADFLFMLRIYDLALTNYRSICFEKRGERDPESIRLYAASQEMIGMSLYMQGMDKVESHLSSAIEAYLKCNALRYATRATFFLFYHFCEKKLFKSAADVLINMSNAVNKYDPLCSAVLQERAAFCYLSLDPPSYRQFGRWSYCAGADYYKVQQLRHSIRCNRAAYSVYKERGWGAILDLLHFRLGRSLFLLGDLEESLLFMSKLLKYTQQPPNVQCAHLREFIHIYSKLLQQEKCLVMPDLPNPLPEINHSSIRIFLSNYDPPSSARNEKEWKDMTNHLLNSDTLTLPSFSHISVLHEYIYVEVEIKNGLDVAVQLNDLQLVCEHHPNEGAVNCEQRPVNGFEVEPYDMLMHPREKKKVLMSVVPLCEGMLWIKSLGFRLCGEVWVEKTLEPHPLDLLQIKVTSEMPLLNPTFLKFPNSILMGEVKKLQMTVANDGQMALTNVKMEINYPGFFVIGKPSEIEEPFPPQLIRDQDTSESAYQPTLESNQSSATTLPLPFLDLLPPGSSVTFPIWARGAEKGSKTFRFLFYYEPEKGNTEMWFRLQRLSETLHVKSSINVSFFSVSAPSEGLDILNHSLPLEGMVEERREEKKEEKEEREYYSGPPIMLCLDIFNSLSLSLNSLHSISLLQLSCISPNWVLTDINPKLESSDNSLIGPGESTRLFFELRRIKNNDFNVLTTTIPLSHQGTVDVSSSTAFRKLIENEKRVSTIKEKRRRAKSLARLRNRYSFANQGDSCFSLPSMTTQSIGIEETEYEFILLWGSKDNKHVGQHHIFSPFTTNDSPMSLSSPNNTLNILSKPLALSIYSPKLIYHPFSQGVSMVGVALKMRNKSNTMINIDVKVLPPNQPDPNSNESEGQYFWMGSTQYKVKNLDVGESRCLPFKMCFCAPGVYNINRFVFMISPCGTAFSQKFSSPLHHFIHIYDET